MASELGVSTPTLQAKLITYKSRPKATDCSCIAQVEGHPRLRFTSMELQAIQSRRNQSGNAFKIDYSAAVQQLLQAAEKHLQATSFECKYYGDLTVAYPVPPVQPEPRENPPGFTVGRYPFWTAMGGQIKTRLETLALAYAFSGEKRFADAVKADLLSLATWDVWSDPTYPNGGKTCLDSGYIVEGVATAYDLVFNIMTPNEQAQVRQALFSKGLVPLYEDTNKKLDHNIHMVRTAALGFGALAILGEEPDMEQYVMRAIENFFWYLDQRLDSGQVEGMMYTAVSMEHIAGFADALERVTGDRTMFEHPFVKEVLPRWVLYFQGPNSSGLVNFSDGSIANYFFLTMASVGRVNKNPFANWYVASPKVASPQAKMLHLETEAEIAPPTAWPDSAVFSDIGWAAMRSGWGANDTMVAFLSSGSRVGHNHMDQNHFIMNVAGKWLIKDPGYQDYQPGPKHEVTWGTLGHNAVLVNGAGQCVRGGGRITSAMIAPAFDYICGDASSAYSGTGLQEWVRQFIYVKPGYYVMLDELLLKQDTDVAELLLHPGAAMIAQQGELNVGYNGAAVPFDIKDAEAGVRVQPVWPPLNTMTVQAVAGAEIYGPYVSYKPALNSKQVSMVTVLAPFVGDAADLQAADVAVVENRLNFKVSSSGGYDYVSLGLHTQPAPTTTAQSSLSIETDALHAVARCNQQGAVTGYCILGGKRLTVGGQVLVDSPVELSGALSLVHDKWVAQLTAAGNAEVRLLVPAANRTSAVHTINVREGMNEVLF